MGKPSFSESGRPTKVEAIIRDDVEALAMWREAMKPSVGRKPKEQCVDNVNALQTGKGNSRAYTASRLMKQRPDLFEKVKAGELSATAASNQEKHAKNTDYRTVNGRFDSSHERAEMKQN